ncbi:MAG: ribosomal protein S18-alanine N-acetyltransferase [Cypionkella sp.]|nr:ribosomal protein S18-alanine N-acetyltransferase [Cypionkella sp.]
MPRAEDLARLHAASFTTPRPWSAAEIAALLDSPHVFLLAEEEAFLMGRVIADEAELLTLAVDPPARRRGLGRALLAQFLDEARKRGATRAFLEVAADNGPACALYQAAGFAQDGRRRDYYHRPDGGTVDALLLSRAL